MDTASLKLRRLLESYSETTGDEAETTALTNCRKDTKACLEKTEKEIAALDFRGIDYPQIEAATVACESALRQVVLWGVHKLLQRPDLKDPEKGKKNRQALEEIWHKQCANFVNELDDGLKAQVLEILAIDVALGKKGKKRRADDVGPEQTQKVAKTSEGVDIVMPDAQPRGGEKPENNKSAKKEKKEKTEKNKSAKEEKQAKKQKKEEKKAKKAR